MAGCLPCFIVPLFLFIFHRYLLPLVLMLWNPRPKEPLTANGEPTGEKTENLTDPVCIAKPKEFQDYLNDCQSCQRPTDKKTD